MGLFAFARAVGVRPKSHTTFRQRCSPAIVPIPRTIGTTKRRSNEQPKITAARRIRGFSPTCLNAREHSFRKTDLRPIGQGFGGDAEFFQHELPHLLEIR